MLSLVALRLCINKDLNNCIIYFCKKSETRLLKYCSWEIHILTACSPYNFNCFFTINPKQFSKPMNHRVTNRCRFAGKRGNNYNFTSCTDHSKKHNMLITCNFRETGFSEVWNIKEASRIKNQSLHHDTGKTLPFLTRMGWVIYIFSNTIFQPDEKRILMGIAFIL